MKQALKFFSLIVMLATITSAFTVVRAHEDEPYHINKVEVEGISFYSIADYDKTVYVERGDTINIDVVIHGTNFSTEPTDNVRIEVELGGYDRDEVRAVTDSFIVEPNVVYPAKRLTLELPDDLNAEDTYNLRVRVYDRDNSVEWSEESEGDIFLRVAEKEHYLKVLDVDFDPNLNYVKAGERIFADVRVENFGYQTEEDIRVVMEIPTLNLVTSSYIDVLDSDRECDRDDDDDDDRYHDGRCENSETAAVSLMLPSNAVGEHKVIIKVEYDDGDEVIEQSYNLVLAGTTQPVGPSEPYTEIKVDTNSQDIVQGEGVVYKIAIANKGDKAQTYSLNLLGLDSWATYSIDPSTVVVGSQETEDVFVFVNANEDSPEGAKSFVLEIKSDSDVESATLMANVKEESESEEDSWESIKLGLEIGFVVLLVILIILGLVLAFKKKDDKDLEEPNVEGEDTYY